MNDMRKKLHRSYFFADGHAVLVYEKHARQAGGISRITRTLNAQHERSGHRCNHSGCLLVEVTGLWEP